MYWKGHYGMALLAYAPVGAIMLMLGYTRLTLLDGVVVVGGAMVSDLGQRVSGIAHRGPTHTLWFASRLGSGPA